jgi:hypothetical protein
MLLSDVHPDGKIVRRRPTVAEVRKVTGATVEEIEEVVWLFQEDDRNFLLPVLRGGKLLADDDQLDVRHEAIFRQWKIIETWRQQEQDSVAWLSDLADSARALKKKTTSEWKGLDLENALAWRETEGPNEAWAARHGEEWEPCEDFLEKCVEKRDQEMREAVARKEVEECAAREAAEQKRKLRERLQKLAGVLTLVFVVFGITASVLWWRAENAKSDALIAKSDALKAQLKAESAAKEAQDAEKQLQTVLNELEEDTKKAVTDIRKTLIKTVEASRLALKQLTSADAAQPAVDADAVELDRYLRSADEQLLSFQELSREKSGTLTAAGSSVLANLARLYMDEQPNVDQARKVLDAIKADSSLKAYVEKTIRQRADKTRVEIARANDALVAAEKAPSIYLHK